MSDTTDPASPDKPAFSPLRLVITVVIVAAVGAGVYFMMLSQIKGGGELDEGARARKALGLGEPVTNRLGSAYTDSDEDLVADAPKEPADQLDPAELTFSFVATEDPAAYESDVEAIG